MEAIGGNIKSVLMFLFLLVLETSCDKTSDVYIDGDSNMTATFECGTVEIVSRCLGGREFVIIQTFDLDNEVTIYKDSVEVIFDDQIIPYTIEFKENELQNSQLVIDNNSKILLRFYVPGGIGLEDTVTINPDGYLYCNKGKVVIGKIHLSL